MMSEAEIRDYAWRSSIKRVFALIDEHTKGWSENGPSKVAADSIVKMLRSAQVPGPTEAPK